LFLQSERMRAGLEEARRRHARAVLAAVDRAAAGRLQAVEADLERARYRNAELEERPYGPKGLLATYGATVGFSATGDTTVEDLLAGTINIANVYSADPRIQTDKLVTLADPEGLFLASNVVPLVNADIADSIADVINAVQAKLTPEGLVALNVESTVDQKSPADIAKQWLSDNGLS
jgi:osmoprotectant transport system substrate-binding protein